MSGRYLDRVKLQSPAQEPDGCTGWRAICDAAGVAHDTDPADVVRAIKAPVLRTVDQELTQAVEDKQSSADPNPLSWQTGALWGRDSVRTRAAATNPRRSSTAKEVHRIRSSDADFVATSSN